MQLISDDLGFKLEKVTPEMLGSCKKVGDDFESTTYILCFHVVVLNFVHTCPCPGHI